MNKNKSTSNEYVKYTPQPKDMVLDDSELTPYPSDDTPAGYGRWDTFTGTITVTSKNTPEQQKMVDEINAQRAAERESNAISEMDEAEARINYRMSIDIVRYRKAMGYKLKEDERKLLEQAEAEGIPAEYSFARHIALELYPKVNYCIEYEDAYVFSDKNDISIGEQSPVVVLKKNGKVINITSYLSNSSGALIREFNLAE